MYKKYVEAPFVVEVKVRKDEEKMKEKRIPDYCGGRNDYKFIRTAPDKGFCVRKEDEKFVDGFNMLEARIFRVLRPAYGPAISSGIVRNLTDSQKNEYDAMFRNMVVEALGSEAAKGFKFIEPIRSTKHLIGSIEDNKPFEPVDDLPDKNEQMAKVFKMGFDHITRLMKKQIKLTGKLIEDTESAKNRLKSIDRRTGATFKTNADIYTMTEQIKDTLDQNPIEDLISTMQEFINWKKRQEKGTQTCSCNK